jgi:hypothetical protein
MPSNDKQYQQDYYQKNKNIIKAKNNEFIFCDVCQCNVRRCYLKIHNETSKHNKIPKQNKPKTKIIIDKEKQSIVKKTLVFLKEILEPDEYLEVEQKSKLLYQTKQDVIIKEESLEEEEL